MKNLGKNERGSITIFVVAAMLFMIIICFTSYTNLFNKMKRQKNDVDNIQKEYGGTDSEKIEQNMEEKYQSIIDKLPEWTQVEEGITNGKVTLKIGDYVNYNHLEGVDTTDTDKISYTSKLADNGYGKQVFNISSYSSETGGWRVLGVEKGKLLLISGDIIGPDSGGYTDTTNGNKFYLKGQAGYKNGIKELEIISSKYWQGMFAESARSVTVNEINRITGYIPETGGYGRGNLWEYGNNVTYSWQESDKGPYYSTTNGLSGTINNLHSSGFYWLNSKNNEWEQSLKSSTATSEEKQKITILQTSYYDYNKNSVSSEANKMLFYGNSKDYWLSSQYIKTGIAYTDFGIRIVKTNQEKGIVGRFVFICFTWSGI